MVSVLPFSDFPVAKTGAYRANTKLAVDAPRFRIAAVFRVIKNREMPPVIPAFDFHPDVEPHGTPSFCCGIDVPSGIDSLAFAAGFPRHAQEQSAVIVFANSDIGLPPTKPLEVEDVAVAVGAHRPALRLSQHRIAISIEKVINRFPLHRLASGLKHLHAFSPPVIIGGVMEIVAAVHTGKAPVQAGLVFVMARAVLGKHAVAIWPDNRMQVWPVIGGGVLRDSGLDKPSRWTVIVPEPSSSRASSGAAAAVAKPSETSGTKKDFAITDFKKRATTQLRNLAGGSGRDATDWLENSN
ncbi:MAG: hypothetical protein CM1200mP29_08050 [Verrucomicrobiota bacterium]|nr:MAG: hypothetical protein CM1200mP29_08050 [Verrucomicrobiota bacterium]